MTDDVSSLGRFLSNVDADLYRQTKDAPNGAETVLTKIKVLFPDTYRQMEKEGVLQLLENPEGLRTYLHEFFKKHREANLPEHVEPRASEVSPGEVAKRVETYETATREADRALHSREDRIRELRAAYVKRVAQNFIDQTRAYYEREAKEVSQSVTAQIEKAQRDAADIPDRIEARQIETYIRQVEENLPQFPEKPAVRMRAQEHAKDINVQYAEATRQHEAAKEAVVEAKKRFFASDNPTTRPDVLLTRAVELSATTPYGATDVARVAELQARAVEFQALDASAVALGGHGFFQTIADPANPGELKRASAADRLFDSLRPEQKMAVVRDIIDRSLARFEGPVAKATEAVGEKVAASQITANAIRQAIQTGDTVRGASTAGSVGAVAEGLFRSFGGIPPQTLQLVGQSKTLEWLNTQSFYAFLMVEKLKTSLGGAGKFVIKEGAEAVAKKVGGKSIGGAIGAWLGTALPLPPGISNAIGYVVGDVILGKIIEWGGAALSAVGYVFSGGVLTSILQGKPASLTDTLFLFPLLIIVLIPLLFIFPWVLNIPQFSDDVRRTALLESMMGGENLGPEQPECLNISISAVPTPSSGIPASIQYAVTASPTCEGPLTINAASVSFSVYGGGSIPAQNISPGQLASGSYTFTVPVGSQFNNSVITATFTINANVGITVGTTGSASISTIIGNPAIECFIFGGAGQPDAYGHTSSAWDDKSGIMAAIGQLARSLSYMAQVCAGGAPVTIYRVKTDFGGGSVSGPNTIFIYNAGSRGLSAVYTLAHETGHIVNHRTGLFSEYNQLALYAREGPIWTYPNGLSEGEDFAETFGVYVVWRSYTFGPRHGHSGRLNYPKEFPLHYQFAKSVFGIEY